MLWRRRRLAVLITTLWVLVSAALSTDEARLFCVQKVANSSHPPLPQLDMPAFTVEYRVNILNKKYSMRATEYYDFHHNKMRLDLQRNGTRHGILFDYEDNTVIEYIYRNREKSEYSCIVEKLDQMKDDNLNVFRFSKQSPSSVPHVLASQDILRFANSTEQEYKGETTLDGLRVTHWQSCHNWENVKANFILDYYFTTKSFLSIGDGTPRQVPIRAEVKGVMGPRGNSKPLHHIYEYMNFRAHDKLPIETFSLPDFMVCEGDQTKWAHEFPIVPESMSYTLERVIRRPGNDNKKAGAIVLRVFLDSKRKLVRIDDALVTSIRDYTTGVQYVISQNSCKTYPITSAVASDNLVKMRVRPEIFYLKQNFSFVGPKHYREISALSFASKTKNNENVMAYITNNNKTPIGVIVKNLPAKVETHYNLFDFQSSAYRSNDMEDPFDIQRCTNSDQVHEFEIIFEYDSDYQGNVKDYAKKAISGLRDYIAKTAGCSVLQISRIDFYIDEGKKEFHLLGIFLEATSITKVAKVENQQPIKTYNKFLSALQSVIEDQKFSKILKVKAAQGEYSLSFVGKVLRSEGKKYPIHSAFDRSLDRFQYFRDLCTTSLVDSQIKRIRNSAVECAKDCLDSSWMGCNVFQYSKESRECIISMQGYLPALEKTPGCDFYTLSYLSHYERIPGEVLLKHDDVLHKQVSTAEICARQCLSERDFKCESFDFCEDQDRCLLYKSHYYGHNEEFAYTYKDDTTSCEHYSRKSLDDFKSVVSTDVVLLGSELTEVEAKSLQHCAYLCQEDCAMFSSCMRDESLVCKFVSPSNVGQVEYQSDNSCSVHKALYSHTHIMNTEAKEFSKSGRNAKRRSQQVRTGYSGGAMFGVAAAMLVTGLGVGALTIFLMHHFREWKGF